MSNPIILSNKDLNRDHVISATEQNGEYIDQPSPDTNNTGALTLSSSGDYFGSDELDLTVILKTAGDLGVAKFLISDDNKTTYYGVNLTFNNLEVIKNNI